MPSEKIAETDDILVIKDIAPKATTHYLILPKKHVHDIRDLSENDQQLAGSLLMMAQNLAKDLPQPGDFRIVINNGPEAGQCVFHLHVHFLAGNELPGF